MIITDVVTEHLEEAAFLWGLRANAVRAPHYVLKDLAKLDGRIEAHIDGLRIAGNAGWELCREALQLAGAGEFFVASVLAFESGAEDRIGNVLAKAADSSEVIDGIVAALGWLPFPLVKRHLERFQESDLPYVRRIAIAGYAVHRQDPGAALKGALSDGNVALKAHALKASGDLGRRDLLPAVLAHLGSDDQELLFQAAFAAALLGESRAVPVLRELAGACGPYAERAVAMALRRMGLEEASAWQRELNGRPILQRLAVQSAGVIGDPALIPWLIDEMVDPPLARVAGEAFTFITGVDLAYQDLEGERPVGFQAGPTEDPNDHNVDMDPDGDLPWPNQEVLHKWWKAHEGEVRKGSRYLCGKPIADEGLQYVLRDGKQRQRAAAAIELSMRNPGLPLFNVKAPGFRQIEQLSKKG